MTTTTRAGVTKRKSIKPSLVQLPFNSTAWDYISPQGELVCYYERRPSKTSKSALAYACALPECANITFAHKAHLHYHLEASKVHKLVDRYRKEFDHDKAYVPRPLVNTAIRVERTYDLAVCHATSCVMLQSDIPEHCRLCKFCSKFDATACSSDPEFKRICDKPTVMSQIREAKNTQSKITALYGTHCLVDSSCSIWRSEGHSAGDYEGNMCCCFAGHAPNPGPRMMCHVHVPLDRACLMSKEVKVVYTDKSERQAKSGSESSDSS
ncbi:hypothetical protein TRVA0_004S00452 [Trichomonascus vanleenenianus]|uniref:uncharacterized protein n=1 Tax=Trichomonascus vanleenenianus TaxID=2268995 RepID=UPI003EC9A689